LPISIPVTAKMHVSRAMIKFGAPGDRARLVVFATKADLVNPRALPADQVAAPATAGSPRQMAIVGLRAVQPSALQHLHIRAGLLVPGG
jgi:hypothetical protein